MNKVKRNNRTMILSVVLIVISVLLVITTTLAYFTDSLTRKNETAMERFKSPQTLIFQVKLR